MPLLIDADWLESHLGEVKVFDCTTLLKPDPDSVYRVQPAREAWLEEHIPGAGFLDLQGAFSDEASSLNFTLPDPQAFARAAGEQGIGNDDHVVLYTTTNPMWATRFWWMFGVFGHHQVSVLDGGFAAWKAAGKPTTRGAERYAPATFRASLDAARVADKERVLDAIGGDTCVLNALSREQFAGEGRHYGRPGRIQASENLPWTELLDADGCFLPPDQLEARFRETGALESDSVITYCGGGIAATMDLFALALIGRDTGVAVYDGSLSEWAPDDALPMETDVD